MVTYTLHMRQIILIAHDLRSCHNIGSLLRTAEGLGVAKIYLTGYTPYPVREGDTRMPHVAVKLHKQIQKTALGAEIMVDWEYAEDVVSVIKKIKSDGYALVGLEQTTESVPLPDYKPNDKIAVLLGREVQGIDETLLPACDTTVEIPMLGKKESFNVVQAAAMVLYHCRFFKS